MKDTTKTIILCSTITLLILGLTIFTMYKIYEKNDSNNLNVQETFKENENSNINKEVNSIKENNKQNNISKENTINNEEKEVTIYIFRGEGCGACEYTIDYFKNTDLSKYKNLKIKALEVWDNTENYKLLEKVLQKLNLKELEAVPFIVINNKYMIGFEETEIYEYIDEAYNKTYTDIVSEKIEDSNNLNLTIEDIK